MLTGRVGAHGAGERAVFSCASRIARSVGARITGAIEWQGTSVHWSAVARIAVAVDTCVHGAVVTCVHGAADARIHGAVDACVHGAVDTCVHRAADARIAGAVDTCVHAAAVTCVAGVADARAAKALDALPRNVWRAKA